PAGLKPTNWHPTSRIGATDPARKVHAGWRVVGFHPPRKARCGFEAHPTKAAGKEPPETGAIEQMAEMENGK
ncbi:MAG TPA: hypothetical protein PLP42_16115, partial [Acidobacteriota bacterium]|nr:hypothetical protein [Acidobacteriota bacterium]